MEQPNRDAASGGEEEHDYTWTELWRSYEGDAARDTYLASLPHYMRRKNDLVSCSLKHDRAEES
ncbi:hypothetical protein F441_05174 [Phytophthora nicotianae CJ01A1]|nr:hypothetical protein L916_04987 [Phytophthora nicotianae]ETP21238.1 hypothetical protein F441_05174 [Phytophthora nicotianae CJ01A1]